MRKSKSALEKEYLEALSELQKHVKISNNNKWMLSIIWRDKRNDAIALMTRYDRWDLRDTLLDSVQKYLPQRSPILEGLERCVHDLEKQLKIGYFEEEE